ncbi:MAG: valine--tRNA ligase [Firmicutes bacterium]|nr:valine--tRNA ligase [Bacillota bacterium]
MSTHSTVQAEKAPSLPPAYDPLATEPEWYHFWLEHDFFRAERDPARRPYCIVIPPPNVTGALHMGHALNNTIQDVLIRWRRMQGYATLWVPGTDHASIATQHLVLNRMVDEGLDRAGIDRETFLDRAWRWKDEYERTILGQLKRLGCSCDWSRTCFTMDPERSRATLTSFVRYYNAGLIYRGDYLVNWCPGCGTAISDIEVVHEEAAGKLYYILYPFADGPAPDRAAGVGATPGPGGPRPDGVVVATTRPETMLGDTAVAVHPDDERYRALVGRHIILPLVGRRLPIVADTFVDPDFGTGAVKVTPAHDPDDFELGRRHGLELVRVIGEDARMTEAAGPAYAGLDRYACREAVIRDLEREGLLVKVEDHSHALGRCDRCDTVVEPLVSKQWFVRMRPLAEPAIEAVKRGEVRFVPERFTRVYLNWMENVRDWCISRQLWWGHRIPVWYCGKCGEAIAAVDAPEACPKCGAGPDELTQDEDVLDTWFSSALWPFSTLGWPEKTEDLEFFFPTSVLVTAYDIIFFWVARMIFSSYRLMGSRPFDYAVIHGLVRAADGRKMSKSLGNGVDPLEVIDRYGADALRLMLMTGISPGSDTRFHPDKVEAARNFGNKLWNAARFVLMNLGETADELEGRQRAEVERELLARGETADRWILSRYRAAAEDATRFLEEFELGEAARALGDFVWGEFCDWYIEMVKPRLYGNDEGSRRLARLTLVYVLDGVLRLLHPFQPFLTEAVWQRLPALQGESAWAWPNPLPATDGKPRSIVIAPWPAPSPALRDEELEADMALVIEVTRAVRNLRAEAGVPAGKKAPVVLVAEAERSYAALEAGRAFIRDLAHVSELELARSLGERPAQAAAAVTRGVEIYLPLRGLIDLEKESARLAGELEQARADLERVRSKLANAEFLAKAPAAVVEKERRKESELEVKCQRLAERLTWMREAR